MSETAAPPEIRFYHLTRTGVDQALPGLLHKAVSGGARIVVRTTDESEAERLSAHLWAVPPESFLPHGTRKDGHAARQPIWITGDDGNENPNGATILMILNGGVMAEDSTFALCCDMFDGRNDDAVNAARQRWKTYKDRGYTLTYWQQTEQGWDRKAG